MNYNEIVGNNIRFERKKRGLTIDELSEIVDIAPGFLGLIERGQRGTSIKNLCRFSSYFSISLDNLIKGASSSSKIVLAENNKLAQKKDALTAYINSMNEEELNFTMSFVKGFKKYEKQIKSQYLSDDEYDDLDSDNLRY